MLDEDLVAKLHPVDHLSRNVRPQVPLPCNELLQTQVREDVFSADVHGPWGGTEGGGGAVSPPPCGFPARGWSPLPPPLLSGRHPAGLPQPISSGSQWDHQGPRASGNALPAHALGFPSEALPEHASQIPLSRLL